MTKVLKRRLTISKDDPFLKMYPPDQPLTRPRGGEVSASSRRQKHVSFLLEDAKQIDDFSKLNFFPNFDGTYDSAQAKINTDILKHSDSEDSAEEDSDSNSRSRSPQKLREVDNSIAIWRDEAYWRLPANVRHAIDVAKMKSKHSEFWYRLQALNDKIFVFRSIFYNKMPSYQRAFLEKKQKALEDKLRRQKEEFEKEMQEMNSKIKSKMKRRKTLALLIEKHFLGPGKLEKRKDKGLEHSESGISAAQMIQNFRKQRLLEDRRKLSRQGTSHEPERSTGFLGTRANFSRQRQWENIERKTPRRRAQSITFSNEKFIYNRLNKQNSEISSTNGDAGFQLSTLNTEANQHTLEPVQLGSESANSIGRHLPKIVNLQIDKALIKEDMNKIAEADELEEQMSPQKVKSTRRNIQHRRNSTPQSVRSSPMTKDKSGQMQLRESISDASRREQAKRSQKLSDFRLVHQTVLSSQSSRKKLASQPKVAEPSQKSNIITMKPASSHSIDRLSRDSKFIRTHKVKQKQIPIGALQQPRISTLRNIAQIIDQKDYQEVIPPLEVPEFLKDLSPASLKHNSLQDSPQTGQTSQNPQPKVTSSWGQQPGFDLSKQLKEMSISLNSPQVATAGEFTTNMREGEASSSAAFNQQPPPSQPFTTQPPVIQMSDPVTLRPLVGSSLRHHTQAGIVNTRPIQPQKKKSTIGASTMNQGTLRELPPPFSNKKINRQVYSERSKVLVEPFKKPLTKGERLLQQLQRQQKKMEAQDKAARRVQKAHLQRPNLDHIINGVRSKMQRHRPRHLTPTKGQDGFALQPRSSIAAESLRLNKALKPSKFGRKLMQMEDIQFISSAAQSSMQDRVPTDLRTMKGEMSQFNQTQGFPRENKEMLIVNTHFQSGPASQLKNSFNNDTSVTSAAATFTPIQDTFVEAAERVILGSEDNATDRNKPHVHSAQMKPMKMGLDPSVLVVDSRNIEQEGLISGQLPSGQAYGSSHLMDPRLGADSQDFGDYKEEQGIQRLNIDPSGSADRSEKGLITPKSPTMNIQEFNNGHAFSQQEGVIREKPETKHLTSNKKRRDKYFVNPKSNRKARDIEAKFAYIQANQNIMSQLKSQKSSHRGSHKGSQTASIQIIKEKKKRGHIHLDEIKKDGLRSPGRRSIAKQDLSPPPNGGRDPTQNTINEFSVSSFDQSFLMTQLPINSGRSGIEAIAEYSNHQIAGSRPAGRNAQDPMMMQQPIEMSLMASGVNTAQPSVSSRMKNPTKSYRTHNRLKKELLNSRSLHSSNYDSPGRRSTNKSPARSPNRSPNRSTDVPFNNGRIKSRNDSPKANIVPGGTTAATSTIKIMKSNFKPTIKQRLQDKPLKPIMNKTQMIPDMSRSPVEGRSSRPLNQLTNQRSSITGIRDSRGLGSGINASGIASSATASIAAGGRQLGPLSTGIGAKIQGSILKGTKQVNRFKGSPMTSSRKTGEKKKSVNATMPQQRKYAAIIQQQDFRPANIKKAKDFVTTQDQMFMGCLAGDPLLGGQNKSYLAKQVLSMGSKPYMPQS